MAAVLTIARLVLLVLAFVFWVVELAGVSGYMSWCTKSYTLNFCNVSAGLDWWTVWFQFFLLFPIIYYTLRPRAFGQAYSVLFAFIAMCCANSFTSANRAVVLAFNGGKPDDFPSELLSFYRTEAAGVITVTFLLFVWLIVTGVELSYQAAPSDSSSDLPAVAKPETRFSTEGYGKSPLQTNQYDPNGAGTAAAGVANL